MLTALRTPFHRFVVRQRLQELAYLTSDRQMRHALGRRLTDTCRLGVRSGWATRTTATVAASIWIWILARELEPERRMRLGRAILGQERSGVGALDWLQEFESDRMNVVGEDTFLLRFNVANGTIAAWRSEGRAIDPGARKIFLAMAAWGLAGMEEAEVELRFEELLQQLGD